MQDLYSGCFPVTTAITIWSMKWKGEPVCSAEPLQSLAWECYCLLVNVGLYSTNQLTPVYDGDDGDCGAQPEVVVHYSI